MLTIIYYFEKKGANLKFENNTEFRILKVGSHFKSRLCLLKDSNINVLSFLIFRVVKVTVQTFLRTFNLNTFYYKPIVQVGLT